MKASTLTSWLILMTVGCASAPKPGAVPDASELSDWNSVIIQAQHAFEEGRLDEAEGLWMQVLASNDPKFSNLGRLGLALVEQKRDIGHGADRLIQLLKREDLEDLRGQVALYAGIASAHAKRCITAQPLLETSYSEAREPERTAVAEAQLACAVGVNRLPFLDHILEHGTDAQKAGIKKVLEETIRNLDDTVLSQSAERHRGEPTHSHLLNERAARALRRHQRDVLRSVWPLLRPQSPMSARVELALSQPRIGVLLPLSGPSSAFGSRLKSGLEAMFPRPGEDELNPHPELRFADVGSPEKIPEAFETLRQGGSVYAAIGVFEPWLARAAADSAYTANIPLLMLTTSDAAMRHKGQVWRALHGPRLTARVAAGAGLARGGRRAVVLRDESDYGRAHGEWFERIWRAAGGTLAQTLTWADGASELSTVAEQARDTDFDTIFMPVKPEDAALLLRHLARLGIWPARRPLPPDQDAGVRAVLVLGTPEWYSPRFHLLGGRYGRFALIPTPFASETARGAAYGRRTQDRIGRAPTVFDALLFDGITLFGRTYDPSGAWAERTAKLGRSALRDGVSSGLNLAKSDALPSLFLLEVTNKGFIVAKDPESPEKRP